MEKDEKVIFVTSQWGCTKCGHTFLSPKPHPCPKCSPEEFEKWKERLKRSGDGKK